MYLFKFSWNKFIKMYLGAAFTIDLMLMINNLAWFCFVTSASIELSLVACETVSKIIANSVAMLLVSDAIDPIYVMLCDLLVLRLIPMIVQLGLILYTIHLQ